MTRRNLTQNRTYRGFHTAMMYRRRVGPGTDGRVSEHKRDFPPTGLEVNLPLSNPDYPIYFL